VSVAKLPQLNSFNTSFATVPPSVPFYFAVGQEEIKASVAEAA